MHLPSWLFIFVLLIQCINAFYPYHEPTTGKAKTPTRRFYPWENNGAIGTDHDEIPTLTIKKGSPNRRALDERANIYPVVQGSTPTMKNSIAINEDGKDLSYFSTFKFGSKGKEMYMLVDTGAANTWVMGSDCDSDACAKHNTFGKADSTTLKISDTPWTISYGTGTVSGVVVNDTVSFAGFDLNMGFGLANTTSDDFVDYPMDGILGLGRPKSDHLGAPTILEYLMDSQLLKANIFGVNLQRNEDGTTDGVINFGAWDSSKFKGDLDYTSTPSSDGLWEIPVDDAGVDGKGAGISGRTAIIDTGTSYMLMPPADAKKLHLLLPGAVPDGDENWKVPCTSTAFVQVTFSGISYDISPEDYVGSVDTDDKLCKSNIIGHQAFEPTQWLLGDVFLKNVYTVFDLDKDRIGFGVKTGSTRVSKPAAAASSAAQNSNSQTTPLPTTAIASSPSPSSPTEDSKSSSIPPNGSSTATNSSPSSTSASKASSQSQSGASGSSSSSGSKSDAQSNSEGLGSDASSNMRGDRAMMMRFWLLLASIMVTTLF